MLNNLGPLALEPPEIGSGSVEIGPGVLWLRMPINLIPHINVWAIADNGGWVVVDTGIHSAEVIESWQRALDGDLGRRRVTRLVATHYHPDHCGMARWLSERAGARLHMTNGEYQMAIVASIDDSANVPPAWLEFYRACGWDSEELDYYRAQFGYYRRIAERVPDTFHRLRDGDDLLIGGRNWTVVVGAGHSPEHASLYCRDLDIFISGDQVLPNISSNVSVVPREPEADPLAAWLGSLERIKTLVPDSVTVLPAHGEPFHGLHARLDALIEGHRRNLDAIRALAANGPIEMRAVFPLLFRREISIRSLRLGTGEALAHLNYLTNLGELRAELDGDGRTVWRSH